MLRAALWAMLAVATGGCHGSGNDGLVFEPGMPTLSASNSTSSGTSSGIGASSSGSGATSAGSTGSGQSSTGANTTGGGTTGGSSTTGSHASSTGDSTGGASTGGTSGGDDGGCPCPSNEFCYPQKNGECVFCIVDVMCNELSDMPVCDTDGSSPNYGLCVGCSPGEPNCDAGYVCDLVADTAGYETCLLDCRTEGRWACGGLAADYTPYQHCDPTTGTCGEGCLQDNDCPPPGIGPPFCDASTGECVYCHGPADCPYATPGCYLGLCGLCAQDSDCPTGLACNAANACFCTASDQCGGNTPTCVLDDGGSRGQCACTGPSDCAPLGEVCQPPEKVSGTPTVASCIPSCLADGGTYCGNLFHFVYPYNYCNPNSGICWLCQDDSQCIGDSNGSLCLDAGFCGCSGTSGCGSDQACDFTVDRCVTACTDPLIGNCPGGLTCNPATGLCQ